MVRKVLQKTPAVKKSVKKVKAPAQSATQKPKKSARQQEKKAKNTQKAQKEAQKKPSNKKQAKKSENSEKVKKVKKTEKTENKTEKPVKKAQTKEKKSKKTGLSYQNVVIGVIGIGTITSAMVDGLCNDRVSNKPSSILLSPRGEENSKSLAKKYPQIVQRLKSNQEVVDKSDWIVVGLRVPHVKEFIPQLKFRNGQKIINLAAMPNEEFQSCIKTPKVKCTVIRVCPLPSMALNVGAPILQPYDKEITELFKVVGNPFPVKTSQEIYSLQGLACLMGPQYGILQTCYEWLVNEQKIEAKVAKEFTMEMFNSIIVDAQHKVLNRGLSFQDMIDEQVKGGLNEANHQYAGKKQVYKQFNNILKATYQKMIAKK